MMHCSILLAVAAALCGASSLALDLASVPGTTGGNLSAAAPAEAELINFAAHAASELNPMRGHGIRDVRLELLGRQQCPPSHPHPCPNSRCCQAGYPICCGGGKCCSESFPVCQPTGCCPKGMTECGTVDPNFCKLPGAKCCGLGVACPVTHECCGRNCCQAPSTKCCKGSTPDKSVCCGEHEVCCDGWCCPEGSQCSKKGYCTVPRLTLGWQKNTETAALVENVCLGIRAQLAKGRPNTSPNGQIVTYAGPESGNREKTDCRSSRKPRCCAGRIVPPGQPGAGTKMTCDEYPFNSVMEGGPGAHVACVSEHANGGGGDLLTKLLRGKHKGFKFLVEVVGIDCTKVKESDVPACNPLS
ncbi:hypothetical protein JDV02_005559 [Purpureocillium takamizusanense]|uniref:Deoxyribonuclease NucA/NucB domain-containing protein n=1 Tax=Purpureocillium takamizusanense TaxID=2060973 RepID=A0A9Q8QGC0_9HYPO|nr:uncharacterized protein JDV02_005559 [Purpureocillium takamizusanense]UNI19373.1 hypothetical protein JDV02_005559 [Purpureocillium takamizusanense]